MKRCIKDLDVTQDKSPPARGRGLKQQDLDEITEAATSPPARGRGLKLFLVDMREGVEQGRPPRGGVD